MASLEEGGSGLLSFLPVPPLDGPPSAVSTREGRDPRVLWLLVAVNHLAGLALLLYAWSRGLWGGSRTRSSSRGTGKSQQHPTPTVSQHEEENHASLSAPAAASGGSSSPSPHLHGGGVLLERLGVLPVGWNARQHFVLYICCENVFLLTFTAFLALWNPAFADWVESEKDGYGWTKPELAGLLTTMNVALCVGILFTAFALGRFGVVRLVVLGAAASLVASPMACLFRNPLAWYGVKLVPSFCAPLEMIAQLNRITRFLPSKDWPVAMGFLIAAETCGVYLAMGLGSVAMRHLDPLGVQLVATLPMAWVALRILWAFGVDTEADSPQGPGSAADGEETVTSSTALRRWASPLVGWLLLAFLLHKAGGKWSVGLYYSSLQEALGREVGESEFFGLRVGQAAMNLIFNIMVGRFLAGAKTAQLLRAYGLGLVLVAMSWPLFTDQGQAGWWQSSEVFSYWQEVPRPMHQADLPRLRLVGTD